MGDIPAQSINPDIYLNRFAAFSTCIEEPCQNNTGIIIVIPCFAEPELSTTLKSLLNCSATKYSHVEVIVVVNDAEKTPPNFKEQNQKNISTIIDYKQSFDEHLDLFLIDKRDLPFKKSGVGMARKIGMDEAVRRFQSVHKDGVIVCLDADCEVSENYLQATEQHFFERFPETSGASIFYEHPFEKIEDPTIIKGIIDYELHLRYYNLCLDYCEAPYAFHTVGSSMAVRSSAYQKQGGMNTRKAGEDFYFLHKIIPVGQFSRLQNTCVYPSPRISERVPFGTGRAQAAYKLDKKLLTYHFDIFIEIKKLTHIFKHLYNDQNFKKYDFHPEILSFLDHQNFEEALQEIKKNTQSEKSFLKRLWAWFNAFRMMKLVHHLRDHNFPNQNITESTHRLMFSMNLNNDLSDNKEQLLRILRAYEKSLPEIKKGS